MVRKEGTQALRDPSTLLIAGVLPFILLFLFGYGVSLDSTHTRLAVVVEAPSPLTDDLLASFTASSYFDVTTGRDRRAYEGELVAGRVRGIVVVPQTFTADVAAGRGGTVQMIVDGTDPNTASLVQAYTEGAIANWQGMRATERGSDATQPINLVPRYWYNAELTSRNFLVPGSIAIVMTLVGTLLTSLVLAREWERGTMEAIMATPVTAFEMLAGKVLPYFVLGLVAMTVCVVLAVGLFGVPFRGSVVALYALSAAFLLPALGQGLLISAVTKNQFLASQLALLSAFLPAFLLSGFIFEIQSMPQPIRWLTYLVPARYLIPSLQTVFLAGDIWPMFGRAIAMLLLFGALFLGLAARATKKRID
nr:ABC transporter permease [Acuticoccus mangrovi]